jgi:hypothetical protein
MKVQESLISLLPPSLALPFKFYYHKFRGRLEAEISCLNQLGENRKRAIDIGANAGFYTYALSRLYDVVEVFEPQSWCTKSILSYSKLSPCQINIHNVGLADDNGSLNLHIPVSEGDYSQLVEGVGSLTTGLASFKKLDGEQRTIEVQVRKLDDYNFQDVSFMKIDVEGYESKVIEGATQTITREKPILLIEIENRHLEGKSITDIFDQISEFGYEGEFLYKGRIEKLEDFYTQIQAKQNYFLEEDSQNIYINNFIFKPLL